MPGSAGKGLLFHTDFLKKMYIPVSEYSSTHFILFGISTSAVESGGTKVFDTQPLVIEPGKTLIPSVEVDYTTDST